MNTTQKIQAVLATGKLTLPLAEKLRMPDGTEREGETKWYLRSVFGGAGLPDQQAYDLVACHWARELRLHDSGRRSLHWDERYDEEIAPLIARGDSEAVISTIHAVLCGEGASDADA